MHNIKVIEAQDTNKKLTVLIWKFDYGVMTVSQLLGYSWTKILDFFFEIILKIGQLGQIGTCPTIFFPWKT